MFNKSNFLPWYLNVLFRILMSLGTLLQLHMKSKKQVEYQRNLPLKKGKSITTETLDLVTNVYEDDNFNRQVPQNKDYASVSKAVHNQKLCNLQKSSWLARIITAFKEKLTNVNIGFSKFCDLKPKWCLLAGSKMTRSFCVFSAHENVVLLVAAKDWDLTYKDLIKLALPCLKYFH